MNTNASTSTETTILHKFPTTVMRVEESTDSDERATIVPGKKQEINIEFSTRQIIQRHKELKRGRKWWRHPKAFQEHSHLGKYPAIITCPNCLNYIETIVQYYSTCITHLLAVSLLPFCLCIFPYQSSTFKDALHYCPKCEIFLGIKFAAGKQSCVR